MGGFSGLQWLAECMQVQIAWWWVSLLGRLTQGVAFRHGGGGRGTRKLKGGIVESAVLRTI